jgi:hypothetical protein
MALRLRQSCYAQTLEFNYDSPSRYSNSLHAKLLFNFEFTPALGSCRCPFVISRFQVNLFCLLASTAKIKNAQQRDFNFNISTSTSQLQHLNFNISTSTSQLQHLNFNISTSTSQLREVNSVNLDVHYK